MTQGLGNSRLSNSRLGIREFSVSLRGSKATEARNSRLSNSSLGILDFYPRNSKFPVIPQLDWGISIRNSKFIMMRSPEGVGGDDKESQVGE